MITPGITIGIILPLLIFILYSLSDIRSRLENIIRNQHKNITRDKDKYEHCSLFQTPTVSLSPDFDPPDTFEKYEEAWRKQNKHDNKKNEDNNTDKGQIK